jgi:hypothetical protein
LNRLLISTAYWHAYYALGSGALTNFEVLEDSVTIFVGDTTYYAVGIRGDAAFANGRVVNLSTLVRLAGPGDSATAGFIITERPRSVLVRAVGPGLAAFGVSAPLANPFLSVQRNGQTLVFNDNWSEQPARSEVEAATTTVGAFPLAAGSADAARVITLSPGAYTVRVEGATTTTAGGTVLIEVYDLPADLDVSNRSFPITRLSRPIRNRRACPFTGRRGVFVSSSPFHFRADVPPPAAVPIAGHLHPDIVSRRPFHRRRIQQ